MRNQNFISQIIDHINDRIETLERELKDLDIESKDKSVITNIEYLTYIKKQYDEYNTELQILKQLQDFYSQIV